MTPSTAITAKLLQLAKRYSSDCETRISCLRDELAEANTTEAEQRSLLDQEDAECECEDVLDQIDHWQATKDSTDAVIREAERAVPLLTPGSAMHPQRAHIECAIGFLNSVAAYWDEDDVAHYPSGLPSFDEYVGDVSRLLRSIEWQSGLEPQTKMAA